jgi:hypothetical protein
MFSAIWYGQVADGIVVHGEYEELGDGSYLHCVEDIAFRDLAGNLNHAQRQCTSHVAPPPGERVKVHYAPGNPKKAYVEGDPTLYWAIVHLAILVVSTICLFVNLLLQPLRRAQARGARPDYSFG